LLCGLAANRQIVRVQALPGLGQLDGCTGSDAPAFSCRRPIWAFFLRSWAASICGFGKYGAAWASSSAVQIFTPSRLHTKTLELSQMS
jgi:hypothetical protein